MPDFQPGDYVQVHVKEAPQPEPGVFLILRENTDPMNEIWGEPTFIVQYPYPSREEGVLFPDEMTLVARNCA